MAPKTWFHDKFTSWLPDTAARLAGPALLTVKVWVADSAVAGVTGVLSVTEALIE